jgi:hypothetical protein
MTDLSAAVTCDADLEEVVGPRPAASMLKSISFLDEHCRELLARSPFVVIGTETSAGVLQAFAVGGAPGFATPVSDTSLAMGDLAGQDLRDGAPVGLLVLVPGLGETLRINGRLAGGRVEVEEAFLHCAKAILRSELWAGPAGPTWSDASDGPAGFLAASPFVLLASVDADGNADVSPKGDPAGLVRQIDDATVAIADRPGNLRTDTLHNFMSRRQAALLALCPGRHQVVEVRGRARVCTDPELLESMRLRNRLPKAAIVLDIEHRELRTEPAIGAAALWDQDRHADTAGLPSAAAIWADHVRRNTDPGPDAEVLRQVISEQAIAAGLALDYKTNL